MKLARREKLTIAIGLIIVLAVLGRQLLQRDPSVANADAETLAGALQTIDTYDGLRRQIERLQEDLGVEAPVVSIAGQEAAIRTDLSERAKKLGLNFYTYLYDRISSSFTIPNLADIINQRAQELNLATSWDTAT